VTTRRWLILAGHDPDAPAVDFLSRPYTAADLAREVEEARAAYERIKTRHGEPEAFRLFRHMAVIVEEAKAECLPAASIPAAPPAPVWNGHTTANSSIPVAGASPRAARSAPASSSKRMLPGTEPTDMERRTAGKRGR
jgi:hypothetical protein